jgi:hypothetical protein
MKTTIALRRVVTIAVMTLVACGVEPDADVESPTSALTNPSALFIVGNTRLNAGDAAVRGRLQALGLTVTVRSDTAATTADAAGKQLILISSTVTASAIRAKYRTVAVPVIVWKASLLDDMGMTGNANGNDFGTRANQQKLSIVAPNTDPMAAGLTGSPYVTTAASTFTWGKPAAAAVVVARLPSDAQKSAIFRYDAGVQMVSSRAPARRVGFFLEDATASVLNTAGQALVDAAIRWAMGTTKVDGAPCSAAAECTSGICADGVCCATSCTGACRSCALPATLGACADVAAGQVDPRGVCVASAQSTCGTTGRCDGAGGCQLHAPGTTCAASSCTGSTFTAARTCDGAGLCQGASQFSCSPYICSGSAVCASTCATSHDCVAPAVCINGACGFSSCTPTSCAAQGANCGTIPDGCGGTLSCGTCAPPETCGGGGAANVCGCMPTSCAAQGKNCGTIADGCGGVLSCGTCAAPQVCGGGGVANVCGCTPTSCAAQGKDCGTIPNGCGGTLSCGTCAPPETCGGGGAANVCGCRPLAACPAGKNCGIIPDGCGGSLSCGVCAAPQVCGGGGIANVCG